MLLSNRQSLEKRRFVRIHRHRSLQIHVSFRTLIPFSM